MLLNTQGSIHDGVHYDIFPVKQDLAKDLLDMFTANKMAKAFFTNGGSDANDTQVSIAIHQTLISYF